MTHKVRVWDLPTRLFHWALVATTIALIVSANIGGNAMTWHLRFGHVMLALLAFRLTWGLLGGRWSRFANFLYSPARLLAYLRGRPSGAHDDVGHSPLGALSVFALLAVLLLQVGSGLMSDDEIAFSGPLTRFVSGATVGLATWWHKDVGKYLLIALVVLHLLAISYYALVRRRVLVAPMVHGDKLLPASAPASRDDAITRSLAALVLAAAGALAWWVHGLGAF